jgi:hypothetical protein
MTEETQERTLLQFTRFHRKPPGTEPTALQRSDCLEGLGHDMAIYYNVDCTLSWHPFENVTIIKFLHSLDLYKFSKPRAVLRKCPCLISTSGYILTASAINYSKQSECPVKTNSIKYFSMFQHEINTHGTHALSRRQSQRLLD